MKKSLVLICLFLFCGKMSGQVGINTTSPAAQLDIRSSSQSSPSNTDGILIPKVDAFPVTNPTATQHGMMVFLTTANGSNPIGFYYWDNPSSSWKGIGTNNTITQWALLGNSGTISGTNFIGTTDNQAIDIRTNNTIKTRITTKGQIETFNTGESVFVGEKAGASDDLTTNKNVAIGKDALTNNIVGAGNTAIGHSSLYATNANSNTGVGYQSLANNTSGVWNTGIGQNALISSTTANYNTVVGGQTFSANTSGSSNSVVGIFSGSINTTGSNNSIFGGASFNANTTGSNNTMLGYGTNVLSSALTNATAIGYNAKVGSSNSLVLGGTGADAVKVGVGNTTPTKELDVTGEVKASSLAGTGLRMVQADATGTLTSLAAGTSSQVLLGTGVWGSVPGMTSDWSLTGNSGTISGANFIGTTDNQAIDIRTNNTIKTRITTKGQIETLNTGNSVFVGEGAGAADDVSARRNVAIGYFAETANTSGMHNVAIGNEALKASTTASDLTAVGSEALKANSTGTQNTAVGRAALRSMTTGFGNTAVGYFAGSNNTGSNNTVVGSNAFPQATSSNNTAMGAYSLFQTTTGYNNTAFGFNTLQANTTGFYNTAIGDGSLYNSISGANNSSLGYYSLFSNTTGAYNTAFGSSALTTNTTGSYNTAIGYQADVTSSVLSNATAIGYNAKVAASNSMALGGTGTDAVKVGIGTSSPAESLHVVGNGRFSTLSGSTTRVVQADANGTLTPLAAGTSSQVLLGTGVWGSVPGSTSDWSLTGNSGTVSGTNFIGTTDSQALDFRTNNTIKARITTKGQIETYNTGSSVFIGQNAGAADDLSTRRNVAVGYSALQSNVVGGYNVALGFESLRATIISDQTAVGAEALRANTTGAYNVAFGRAALRANTTALDNTAIGYGAQYVSNGSYNTSVGAWALSDNTTGTRNTGIGRYSLSYNITGNDNTALGANSLIINTGGSNNTAVGSASMYSNTTGISNTAIGNNSLTSNTTANQNAALGEAALYYTTTGSSNTATGHRSLFANTTGAGNTGTGDYSLYNNVTGSNNTAIGYYADVSSSALTNATAIGYNAKVSASNSMALGGTGSDAVNVGIGTTAANARLEVNGSAMLSSATGNADLQFNSATRSTIYPNGANTPANVGLQVRSKGTSALQLNTDNSGNVEIVNGGGNVGIGTTTPTQAKVVISGSQTNTLSYGYLNSSTTGTGSGTYSYSLYASQRIAATEFNAFSDKRIKNIKGISDGKQDLATLEKIEITDYKFKDEISKGKKSSKKVIAQQVESVYPNAVSQIIDVVPDIYALSAIKQGTIELKNDLKVGERVKLIFENEIEMAEVTQAEPNRFAVNSAREGKVFVYGREVNDFRTVDYEALTTLTISATQEIVKQLSVQQKRIEELENQNKSATARLDATENAVKELQSLLA